MILALGLTTLSNSVANVTNHVPVHHLRVRLSSSKISIARKNEKAHH